MPQTDPQPTLIDRSQFARDLQCPCCKLESGHHVYHHACFHECNECHWKFTANDDGSTRDWLNVWGKR